MLIYQHPRFLNSERGRELWLDAQRWTEHIVDVPMERLANRHFTAICTGIRRHTTKKDPQARGSLFELCIYDLLARLVPKTELETCIQMVKGKNAEADFLVSKRTAILAKTSLRERWKQIDRDAMVMQNPYNGNKQLVVYGLVYKERDTDTLEQVRSWTESKTALCMADVRWVSVIDYTKMAEFISTIAVVE